MSGKINGKPLGSLNETMAAFSSAIMTIRSGRVHFLSKYNSNTPENEVMKTKFQPEQHKCCRGFRKEIALMIWKGNLFSTESRSFSAELTELNIWNIQCEEQV